MISTTKKSPLTSNDDISVIDVNHMLTGKILVVEENNIQRMSIRILLEIEGNDVDECSRLDQAYETSLQSLPDLIIVAWGSDHEKVKVLMQSIVQHPELNEIPIIVVTSMIDTETLKAAFSAGAADYIRKPIEKTELLSRVENALRLSKLHLSTKKQLGVIQSQQKEIRDSIQYAQHIQHAVLPTPEYWKKMASESFIFYKPKDPLSGDFYWAFEKDGKKVIAMLDCTGHGIPGALISILGVSLLNEAVSTLNLFEPAQILKYLDEQVKSRLNRQGLTDGMDAAVVVIDRVHQSLKFAGANLPLLYMEFNQLREIKGTRYGIGGLSDNHLSHYQEHALSLKTVDSFYLLSDGYQSQFGGIRNKKIGYAGLKKMIAQNAQFDMGSQKRLLKEHLELWQEQGNEDQVDDILIIGISLSEKKAPSLMNDTLSGVVMV